MQESRIHSKRISRLLLFIHAVIVLIYFSWWFLPGHAGNPVLYYLLFFGETYHVFMILAFLLTIWPGKKPVHFEAKELKSNLSVDIFITVVNESVELVRETVLKARSLSYENFKIFILNDGFVAGNKNWEQMEKLAKGQGVVCITRQKGGGAKAGNINNALTQTKGEVIVIFDADMQPHSNFLEMTMYHFNDKKMAFVQSPQYYKNHSENTISAGAWEQQDLFFGPIMQGKDRHNSAFICGTNVAIRRSALMEVGGMCEDNIAEDFLTSLYIHQKGWKSHYVKEVLAEGLAPSDMLSYYKQQLRWARGSLEVLFGSNPLFKKGLTFSQKIQYLSSALYYFNGVVVLIDILMPLIYLFFGIEPVTAKTTSFALYFIPFMFLNLYVIYLASEKTITLRAISFSQSSWTLQLVALKSVLFRQKTAFAVTAKQAVSGNFLSLAYIHIGYIALSIAAIVVGLMREGAIPAVTTNIAWIIFNSVIFLPFITAAAVRSNKNE